MLLAENDVVVSEKGRYQIRGKIGSESSFGAVFKALDEDGRPVVVKQLLGSSRIARDTDMDPEYARRTFEREAEILLGHNHPRIVRGLDFFARDEDLMLVMELINGEDLDQVLVKRLSEDGGTPFDEGEAVSIGIDLCNVIHAVHQLPGQVLYRDLKPRNVMWDAGSGTIKLIDFGTARFMDESSHSTRALGTPGYAPPELYSTTESLSFASDVYTIGATLYELVTGEIPEPLMTPVHFHGYESGLSEPFRRIILRAMAQKPRNRYQTAAEMGEALSLLSSAGGRPRLTDGPRNPFPFLSCLCVACGEQPGDDSAVFCHECGAPIHVLVLRIKPQTKGRGGMDLFLDKRENLIGRLDMDAKIYPDVDLSRYDPECYVSRRHCLIRRKGTRFYLEPLKTTNSTMLAGYPLTPGRAVEISSPAEITLANLELTFLTRPCLEQGPVRTAHA